MTDIEIVLAAPQHLESLTRFFNSMEAADRTFLWEAAADPASLPRVVLQGSGRYLIAVLGNEVVGFSGLTFLADWSRHVGELRVVVDPAVRGQGLGARLVIAALAGAHEAGLEKVLVEIRSDQEPVQRLFSGLGFRPEALLTDQLKAPDGTTYDLLTFAHRVDEVAGFLAATGLAQSGSGQ